MRTAARSGMALYLLGLLVVGNAGLAGAADDVKWPQKVVRVVVPSGPGAVDDIMTRLITAKLSDSLRQQFIVDNRPGAGGLIGQSLVMKAPPDGYTWLYAGGSMAGARYVNAQATYDVLRDFTPVSLLQTGAFVMVVHPAVPARNVKEYIALARSQPGKMTYAVLGAGQIAFWAAHLFNHTAGIKAVEVPYKTGPEAMTDIMTGRIDYFFPSAPLAVTHKDKVRVLAVTGRTRSPVFPDAPTMSEAALPGYEMPSWGGIVGPAGVRADVVAILNASIVRAVQMPDVREKMTALGVEPTPSTPEEFAKRFAEAGERFGKVARAVGLKPQ